MKTKLIGSAPSKDSLQQVLCKFFYSAVTIQENGEVHNSKGKIEGIQVRETKGRWRAEMVIA